MTRLEQETLRAIAAEWRLSEPEHDSGVVLIWQNKAYGWKNKLRDPQSERPGVYAVDDDGHIFKTEGGNDYDGAAIWAKVDTQHGS